MARTADFSEPINNLAAERAAFKCSVPFCRKGTVGPGATPDASAKAGTACHIYSASENGPRGSLTSWEKGGHIRTVPGPDWVKVAIDRWVGAADLSAGRLFRCVCRAGKCWGDRVTERVVWH